MNDGILVCIFFMASKDLLAPRRVGWLNQQIMYLMISQDAVLASVGLFVGKSSNECCLIVSTNESKYFQVKCRSKLQ